MSSSYLLPLVAAARPHRAQSSHRDDRSSPTAARFGCALKLSIQRRSQKDSGHRDEAGDPSYPLCPTADCRIILSRNAAFLAEHYVGKAGDVRDGRMIPAADPILPLLLRKPKLFLQQPNQRLPLDAATFHVLLAQKEVVMTRHRDRACNRFSKGK